MPGLLWRHTFCFFEHRMVKETEASASSYFKTQSLYFKVCKNFKQSLSFRFSASKFQSDATISHWEKHIYCYMLFFSLFLGNLEQLGWETPNSIFQQWLFRMDLQPNIPACNHGSQDSQHYRHSVPAGTGLGGGSDSSSVPLQFQTTASLISDFICRQTALRNRENMGTAGLCLRQYNYWPGMAADLSSPTTNHSRLIANTARQQAMPQTGYIYKSRELHL